MHEIARTDNELEQVASTLLSKQKMENDERPPALAGAKGIVAHFRMVTSRQEAPTREQDGVSRDMNLESQRSNAYPEHTHMAPDVEQPDQNTPTDHSETRFGFKARDFVVYPAHGAGQILAIEEQTVAGASLEFFVVYFAKKKMTLRVPTRKVENLRMRKLSDPATIEHVRRTLGQRPCKARGNWSRLAQEYESKINSGDIIAVAEVVRDLYRPALGSGQSFSERQLYVTALDRLSGEVAQVRQITEEEAALELESLVMAGAGITR
jgi:CarD family transcriptional regulator